MDMTNASGSGSTVLIAEDEEPVKLLATSTIKAQGFNVLAASNADEAFEFWDGHADEIVLLFTDIVMPGRRSGLDVAKHILASRPGVACDICERVWAGISE